MNVRDIDGAIDALLDDVAASTLTADLVHRWGVGTDSLVRPGGRRVECPPTSPIAALEIRPWDADGYGWVDLELRQNVHPSWPDLQARFGPFVAARRVAGSPVEHVARVPEGAGHRARIALVVALEDERVVGLTIRRDRPRGG